MEVRAQLAAIGRQAIAVALAITLAWGIVPTPVQAHSGHHYAGAQTTTRYTGALAWINTDNAAVRKNTGDFIANRILGEDTLGNWLEIGWSEVGWKFHTNGNPDRQIYTYSSADFTLVFP